MRFIQQKRSEKVNWVISEQTRSIVENYAKFTNCSDSEVADLFLKNILSDPDFQHYLKTHRRTKRIIDRIFYGDSDMKLLYEYSDGYLTKLSDLAHDDLATYDEIDIAASMGKDVTSQVIDKI